MPFPAPTTTKSDVVVAMVTSEDDDLIGANRGGGMGRPELELDDSGRERSSTNWRWPMLGIRDRLLCVFFYCFLPVDGRRTR